MSDSSSLDAVFPSTWCSISPHTLPLSLAVQEITSVSATFVLSSTLSDRSSDLDYSLALWGLADADDDPSDDKEQAEDNNKSVDSKPSKGPSIITDALAKGLSVNVNGQPWQRVFIKIGDKVDEAIIIIYALMPGRQYDIELGIVQAGHGSTLKRQVVTEEDLEADADSSEFHTDPDFDAGNSSDAPHSTPSTSPSCTLPDTSLSSSPQITIEERLCQLQQTLVLVNSERETLQASLKSARRDAQKADAALRTEMEILKRASEKHVAGEHRARQKILALQEAVKRAQSATRETEETVKKVEMQIPVLSEQKLAKEEEYKIIKDRADHIREEKNCEAKKLEAMRCELSVLSTKMEKLSGKRERLENGTIPDMEEQLREIIQEIEHMEGDTQRYTFDMEDSLGKASNIALENISPLATSAYLPIQRPRLQSMTGPGTIGRPAPIQRPSAGESYATRRGAVVEVSPRQAGTAAHNPRAASQHQQSSVPVPLHHRQSSLNHPSSISSSRALPSVNVTPPMHSSSLAQVQHSTAAVSSASGCASGASTLSSHAPAFEPGKPIKAGILVLPPSKSGSS